MEKELGGVSTFTNSPSISGKNRRRNVAIVSWSGWLPACLFPVLVQEAVAAPQFDQMARFGIDQGEPASRPQYAHRLGEIARREDAEDEIERGILHRPLGPQIGDREGQAGAAAGG